MQAEHIHNKNQPMKCEHTQDASAAHEHREWRKTVSRWLGNDRCFLFFFIQTMKKSIGLLFCTACQSTPFKFNRSFWLSK